MVERIKKLIQIGRLFFYKGFYKLPQSIASVDSKSPEYYLLALQGSRVEFTNLKSSLKGSVLGGLLVRSLFIFLKVFVRYFQLKAAIVLAQSYVLESQLMDVHDEFRKNSRT